MYKIVVFLFAQLYFFSAFAQLQNTGWRRPMATHAPNNWTNPQNAFGSDNQYAEVIHQSGCRCPFMDLSWDDGVNFSNSVIFGPYDTVDTWRTNGDSTDNWGHSWSDSEFSDSLFVLRIWNSSTLLKQGYSHFSFGIPAGSVPSGIEVRVEAHGDTGYTYDMVDAIEANVYYYLPTKINEAYADERLINVFPNPAHDQLHLMLEKENSFQHLQIVNAAGEIVLSQVISDNNAEHLDISRLAPGVYFLNVMGEKEFVRAQLMVY